MGGMPPGFPPTGFPPGMAPPAPSVGFPPAPPESAHGAPQQRLSPWREAGASSVPTVPLATQSTGIAPPTLATPLTPVEHAPSTSLTPQIIQAPQATSSALVTQVGASSQPPQTPQTPGPELLQVVQMPQPPQEIAVDDPYLMPELGSCPLGMSEEAFDEL